LLQIATLIPWLASVILNIHNWKTFQQIKNVLIYKYIKLKMFIKKNIKIYADFPNFTNFKVSPFACLNVEFYLRQSLGVEGSLQLPLPSMKRINHAEPA
jgi:hypothetical protein